MNSLDGQASADSLSGSSHGRFSCAASIPAPLSRRNQNTTCCLVLVFTVLPASQFLAVNAQNGRFIVKQATASEGANFAFYPCSNAFSNVQPTEFRGQGYLEVFDTVDLLPQDLVSADVLRE